MKTSAEVQKARLAAEDSKTENEDYTSGNAEHYGTARNSSALSKIPGILFCRRCRFHLCRPLVTIFVLLFRSPS